MNWTNGLRKLLIGLENRVTWHGWVGDTSSYFSNSDIFLHTADDEACPLVHIEALYSGIPIVSTSNGGCKDVLKSFYRGIDSNDPRDYVTLIVEIANNYPKFQKIAASYIPLARNRFHPEISAIGYFGKL